MESLKQIRRFKYFMGIDQHKRYSHIMVIDEVGDVVEERKLYHHDKEGMLNYFKSFNPQETKVVRSNWILVLAGRPFRICQLAPYISPSLQNKNNC